MDMVVSREFVSPIRHQAKIRRPAVMFRPRLNREGPMPIAGLVMHSSRIGNHARMIIGKRQQSNRASHAYSTHHTKQQGCEGTVGHRRPVALLNHSKRAGSGFQPSYTHCLIGWKWRIYGTCTVWPGIFVIALPSWLSCYFLRH